MMDYLIALQHEYISFINKGRDFFIILSTFQKKLNADF